MPHTHLRYKGVEVVEVERKDGLGKWWNAPAFSLGLHSRQEMGTLPSQLKPVVGGQRTLGEFGLCDWTLRNIWDWCLPPI